MYNRYTPLPDGSYRRDRMQDKSVPQKKAPPPPPPPCMPQEPPCREEAPCPPPPPRPKREPSKEGISGFLRQLLPKDFDTGDLLIILLLLLMAGDCEEDRSNALLTLALYLFM